MILLKLSNSNEEVEVVVRRVGRMHGQGELFGRKAEIVLIAACSNKGSNGKCRAQLYKLLILDCPIGAILVKSDNQHVTVDLRQMQHWTKPAKLEQRCVRLVGGFSLAGEKDTLGETTGASEARGFTHTKRQHLSIGPSILFYWYIHSS